MPADAKHVLKSYLQGARDTLLQLDATGHVAHWGGVEVTLHEVMVHKTVDLQRHAGHADILREQIDGSTGLLPSASNLPDHIHWPAYVAELTALADRYAYEPTRTG